MAIGDVFQTRVCWFNTVQLMQNILHMEVTSQLGTGATPQQIATAFEAIVATDAIGLIPDVYTFIGVGVRQVKPVKSIEYHSNVFAANGSLTGTPLPKQVAGLITLRTATPGRRGHGRVYLPAPDVTRNTTDGRPTAGWVTLATNYAASISGSFSAGAGGNTSTLKLCVYSRDTQTIHPLTSVSVSSTFATQRKRGDYGRTNLRPF